MDNQKDDNYYINKIIDDAKFIVKSMNGISLDEFTNNELVTSSTSISCGSMSLSRLLFEEATDINFYVGRAINPAHQNPDLPINFSIKMNLVEDLSKCLKKMGKRIKVSYF